MTTPELFSNQKPDVARAGDCEDNVDVLPHTQEAGAAEPQLKVETGGEWQRPFYHFYFVLYHS